MVRDNDTVGDYAMVRVSRSSHSKLKVIANTLSKRRKKYVPMYQVVTALINKAYKRLEKSK